jgi:nucleoside-diphosphate-sugar epimerase
MTILTARGSFSEEYLSKYPGEVASTRELTDKAFRQKISTADVIIHNASTIDCSSIDLCLERNFDFTRKLIGIIKDVNPDVRLIFLSSMSLLDPSDYTKYGNPLDMTPYAYSKYLSETYILRSDLVNMLCVRFSTLFYRDPEKDGLSRLVSEAVQAKKIKLYNNGEARRNFIPLEIAAQYVNKVVVDNQLDKKVFNIVNTSSTSFADVGSTLKRLLPELEIENINSQTNTDVLSEFGTEDIDLLGRIDFDLSDSIANYYEYLVK